MCQNNAGGQSVYEKNTCDVFVRKITEKRETLNKMK